jgi:hypothetical protein
MVTRTRLVTVDCGEKRQRQAALGCHLNRILKRYRIIWQDARE